MPMPSEKSESMEKSLQEAGEQLGNKRDRHVAITTDQCVLCDEDASTFKDDASRREYTISGMCQVCQDSIFG